VNLARLSRLALRATGWPASASEQRPTLELAYPVAAGDEVPFQGTLDGVVTITPLDPPFVIVDVDATGNATELGKFALAIPHIVDRSTHTAIGSYEFTAANGDTPVLHPEDAKDVVIPEKKK